MSKKRILHTKYKVGDKVQFRHSINNLVYVVYAINIYKDWRVGYNINIDSNYEVADEYQLKKVKKIKIWYATQE